MHCNKNNPSNPSNLNLPSAVGLIAQKIKTKTETNSSNFGTLTVNPGLKGSRSDLQAAKKFQVTPIDVSRGCHPSWMFTSKTTSLHPEFFTDQMSGHPSSSPCAGHQP
jgi:hypothetical protein